MEDDKSENQNGILDDLSTCKNALNSTPVLQLQFSDFTAHFPLNDGGIKIDQSDLIDFSKSLKAAGLCSFPKIGGGHLQVRLDSSLVLFLDSGEFDHDSIGYRYALSSVRVGVIMALMDGKIDVSEVEHIENFINEMDYLRQREKLNLIAYCNYLSAASRNSAESEPLRDFFRISTSAEDVVSKITTMPVALQQRVLEIATDVAVADGKLDPHELTFLKNLYRALEIPAKKARLDLKRYAEDHHIRLTETGRTAPAIDEQGMEELELAVEDIFDDFESF